MLMRCVHCGMVKPDTVIFCQNCGWRIAGTQRAIGSSSFPPHVPAADSLPPTRSSRLDTSLPVASRRAYRTRGRGLWRLGWVVLALLVVGAGLALLIRNPPQPAASVSQRLLTYYDALQRGAWPRAL